MTVKELAARIGWKGLIDLNGLLVAVEVVDARESWGRVQVMISAGHNTIWVDELRLR